MEGHAQPQPSLRLSSYPQATASLLRRSGRHRFPPCMNTHHDRLIQLDDYRDAAADYLQLIDERAFRDMKTLLFGVKSDNLGPTYSPVLVRRPYETGV